MQAHEHQELVLREMASHRRNMQLLAWSQVLSVVAVGAGALSAACVDSEWLKLGMLCVGCIIGYPSVAERLAFWIAGHPRPYR